MLSGLQFNKEVQIKLASLILKEARCSWCKERLHLYLMNRCIRDPYVQWCERRTSSLTSGEAVYSIVRSCLSVNNSVDLVKRLFHPFKSFYFFYYLFDLRNIQCFIYHHDVIFCE